MSYGFKSYLEDQLISNIKNKFWKIRGWLTKRRVKIPILLYHNIDQIEDDPYAVEPDHFQRQMECLKKNNITPLLLSEAWLKVRNERWGNKYIVLTFDDGSLDFINIVMPILSDMNFKATVFVVAGMPAGRSIWRKEGWHRDLVNYQDMKEIIAGGHEIGSHGLLHRDLLSIQKEDSEREIVESKMILEKEINTKIRCFSYPWGFYNNKLIACIKKTGYEFAVTIGMGREMDRFSRRFAIQRKTMMKSDSMLEFMKKAGA